MNDMVEVIDNPSTLALLNKSEIDIQISTAKKYPRSIKKFRDESLSMATLTERVADECHYALPRKENGSTKMIEGPSARFAEIIACAWGNCRAGARVVSEDDGFIVAQGAFHDLERNVAINYEVRRRITDKSGRKFSADMVSVTANAACSIALRNAILKGVPKAFWSDIYDQARVTAMGDAKTLTNRRSEAMAYFKKLGVTQEEICKVLGIQSVEDIDMERLATIKGLATSIKDGESTVESIFRAKSEPAGPAAGVAEKAKERFKGSASAEKTVAAATVADPDTGELPMDDAEFSDAAPDKCDECGKPMKNGACRELACPAGRPE